MKTFIFDLGNVLVFFDHQKIFANLAAYTKYSPEKLQGILKDRNLGLAYESGKISTEMLYKNFTAAYQSNLSYEKFIHALTNIFWPNQSMIDWIYILKKQGHELLALSNTCEAHFLHLCQHYPVLKEFDQYILSHQVGVRKPDPRIYQIALTYTKNSVDNCLFFDDLPENVAEAKNQGIQAFLFENVKQFEEDLKTLGLNL